VAFDPAKTAFDGRAGVALLDFKDVGDRLVRD
jgi:hypothetical protein